MDERIEKAFEVANYMATLSNQRRIILEEYNQKLVHYLNGATFKITPELINFIKTLLDIGKTTNVTLVDSNNFPVQIPDVQKFFDSIVSIYFEATDEYNVKYSSLKSRRNILAIVEL
jgi:hypothetical protein